MFNVRCSKFDVQRSMFGAICLIIGGSVAATQPNVILMMADDLAYNDIACYGSTRQKTPALDKLASEGIRLTSYYSGNTVCTPSRMALLTGAYPTRVGWRGGVMGYKIKSVNGLATEALTLAEAFKSAGYKTAISGKWHVGDMEPMLPMNQGFDSAYYIRKSNNQTKKLFRDGELLEDPFTNRMLSEQFTTEAIRFIDANKDNPFFLYVPFTAPHFPAQSHPDWKGKSNNAAFGDVVEELDFRVGQILETLKKNKLEKKTIVIFTSDNGTDRSQIKWSEVAPFRGIKWSSQEGGSRVACIIRSPDHIKPGTVSDMLATSVDLFPTLTAACDIDVSALPNSVPKIDGHNIWKTLTGNSKAHPRKEIMYWHGWSEPQAIRVGSFKLYFDPVKDIAGSEKQPVLFNLKDDPQETKDLSLTHPEKVTDLLAQAKKILKDIEANNIPLGGPPLEEPTLKEPTHLSLQ